MEEDQRVFLAYQDCVQLQLQLNLAHHAVQRLRVSLGAGRRVPPGAGGGGHHDAHELVQGSSTEQLRTVIRYLLDTLLSLLHSNNGELTGSKTHFNRNFILNRCFFFQQMSVLFFVCVCIQFSMVD